MKEGFIHPNLNLENLIDLECRFSKGTAVEANNRTSLSNSFGFGGINTSIILKRESEVYMQTNKSIVIVVPPFRSDYIPAIGVSLIKANLIKHEFPTTIRYLNLKFSKQINPYVYSLISELMGGSDVDLGDFIFSCLYYERSPEYVINFVNECCPDSIIYYIFKLLFPNAKKEGIIELIVKTVNYLINEADIFIKASVKEITDQKPWVVGISTSMQENMCSVLLARELKKINPSIITVLGGANCQDVMGEEILLNFSEIDYISQGEGDYSFVEFIQALDKNKKIDIPGHISKDRIKTDPPVSLDKEAIERLPYPDYDDFFKTLESLKIKKQPNPTQLVMETSRGCWKGQKQQCRFCGLNATFGINFRSKTSQRVIDEIDYLTSKYNNTMIKMVDNIIDVKYFKSLLPELKQKELCLFFETQGFLSEEQVQILKEANVLYIQAGIESLSNNTLEVMNKGTTENKNICTIKWCTDYGIRVAWLFLFGFPGEDEDEIFEVIRDEVSLIHHLYPPLSAGILQVHRYSKYFLDSEEYNLSPLLIKKHHRYIYDLPDESLYRIVYSFDSQFLMDKRNSDAYKELHKIIDEWKSKFLFSHLIMIPTKKKLIIIDTRSCRRKLFYAYTDFYKEIYQLCSKGLKIEEITESLGADQSKVKKILEEFIEKKLILCSERRYISLANKISRDYKKFPEDLFSVKIPVSSYIELSKKIHIPIFLRSIGLFRLLIGNTATRLSNLFSEVLRKSLILVGMTAKKLTGL